MISLLIIITSLMTSSFPLCALRKLTWDRKTCHQYGDSASSENLCHHLHLSSHLLPQPCNLGWLSFTFSLLLMSSHICLDLCGCELILNVSLINSKVCALSSFHETWGRSLTLRWV